MEEDVVKNERPQLWWMALVVVVYFILLAASIYMLMAFYVCDSGKCKIFNDSNAKAEGPLGSVEHNKDLLSRLGGDGIWPTAFISASIATALSLWLVKGRLYIRDFAIMFLISFLCFYTMISFVFHHYVKPVTNHINKNYNGNNDVPDQTNE